MLYLKLLGKALRLRPNTSLNMEVVNPLLTDGIQDSHSMPVEVPVEGNELQLGHVHQLALAQRTLVLPGAEAGHNGLPLHSGSLTVTASDPKSVRTTLSAEAFVVLMGDTKLRKALQYLVVDMLVQSGSIAQHVVDQNALVAAMPPGADDTGWTHFFPLYSNPELYGSENPSWYPSASDYDATKAYQVDELITFYPPGPVRRGRRYQCIIATSAGQSPITGASKWKELADGLANVMDPVTGEPKPNTVDGNYYALVPWWRLRYLVLKTLEHFGVEAAGDAFLPGGPLGAKSMYVVGNNVPLDAEQRNGYLRASQNSALTFTEGSDWRQFRLPAQNDSTDGNEDADDMWDPVTSMFTPPTAGTYQFILQFTVNFSTAAHMVVVARLNDGSGFNNGLPPRTRGTVYTEALGIGVHQRTIEFALTFSPAQVGVPIYFSVFGAADNSVVWPATSAHSYTGCVLRAWKTVTDGINTFRSLIQVADHAPDWTAAEFLDRVADTFNLEVVPDMERRVVYFNRRQELLSNVAANTTHHRRLMKDVELDHGRRTKGVRFAWPVDLGEQVATRSMRRAIDVDFEEELTAPPSLQQYVVVRSTRRLYVSRYSPGSGVAWEPRGYLIPEALQGEEAGARQISPEFTPVHMAEIGLDEDRFLVPLVEEAGNSSFFGGAANEGKAWLAIANGYSRGAEGAAYVTATSWGRVYDADVQQPVSLMLEAEEDGPANHWDRYHRKWWQLITTAEAVTGDLLVDHSFLRGSAWRRFLVDHHQTYLVEKMPVVYGSTRGPLVSKSAYLLRVNMPESETVRLPFLCTGPGYMSLVVSGTGALNVSSTSGFYTIRHPDDTTSTHASDETVDGLEPGNYCLWASDADAELMEDTITYVGLGDGVSEAVMAGLADAPLTNVTLLYTNIVELVLPEAPTLTSLDVQHNALLTSITLPTTHAMNSVLLGVNALTEAAVDAVLANLVANATDNGMVTMNLGTNAPPSAAGLADKATLEGRGWTVTVNT